VYLDLATVPDTSEGAMTAKMLVSLYLVVLVTVAGLYVFTASFSVLAHVPTPGLESAIPVFVDLLKVIVGAAIGSFSTALGKTSGNNPAASES
jgi:hypothetical protein